MIGRESGGGLIPLFINFGYLPQSGGVCIILRDVTGLKRREDDLRAARRDAHEAEEERDSVRSALRHELRQPLDAIISLSETINEQAFGRLGDNRYHALAREIATKSRQARGVVGRLLGEPPLEMPAAEPAAIPPAPESKMNDEDASQINDALAEAVSLVQPRANARRIIIRAALSPVLARTPSDPETLKEIALQLLQGAVHFTPAGGQIVVSTAVAASGETVLRFRDNGIAPGRRQSAGAKSEGKAAESAHLHKARGLAEGSARASLFMQFQAKACWWRCSCRKPKQDLSIIRQFIPAICGKRTYCAFWRQAIKPVETCQLWRCRPMAGAAQTRPDTNVPR
nr:hypothetical protein [Marinicella sp. W31]MDC2875804.1 hypothetical protein [Marinicella sp. W31]